MYKRSSYYYMPIEYIFTSHFIKPPHTHTHAHTPVTNLTSKVALSFSQQSPLLKGNSCFINETYYVQ